MIDQIQTQKGEIRKTLNNANLSLNAVIDLTFFRML